MASSGETKRRAAKCGWAASAAPAAAICPGVASASRKTLTRERPCAVAAARWRFSAISRNAPTIISDTQIIATATKLLRLEIQIRRMASRKKYERVFCGRGAGKVRVMRQSEDAFLPRGALGQGHLLVDHPAVIEADHAAAALIDQVAVVRGDEHRRAAQVRAVEDLHDLARQVGIEVAGRLVGHDDHRVVDQRAGDGHALLLAAGQLRRIRGHLVAEVHRAQHVVGLFLVLARRQPEHGQDEREVLEDGHPLDELEVLKDHPQLAAEGRELPAPDGVEVPAVDDDLPLGGPHLPQDQLSMVDLPAPLGPVRKTNSPFSMWKVTSVNAVE